MEYSDWGEGPETLRPDFAQAFTGANFFPLNIE